MEGMAKQDFQSAKELLEAWEKALGRKPTRQEATEFLLRKMQEGVINRFGLDLIP